ncbi:MULTISPECIES: NAD(P)/FAD-dependent oxidoreductase [unclassified Kitasatospora]|uniref:NAD(P)/FAD-dependent oxidoreductase n=1 Tax=unclassified Kitasatospora TaxID=2633591 RepID=UPI002474DB95|nr:FAD-dependent oxidoreductase [Kitasatospora sp. MAP12-44]
MNQVTSTGSAAIRILIVGGGCAGLTAAARLQQGLRAELRGGTVEITVVENDPYLTYRPLLAEVAAGSIDPRHVVVPLRRALPECRVLTARIARIDHARRLAWIIPETGPEIELPYDRLVLTAGSVSRRPPIPGLAEHGLGFGSVGQAVGLRNHILEQLDIASSTRDPELRQSALTFVFVGGGYAGVGALAELEDMARYALRGYHNIQPDDLRWVLVEAGPGILAEADPALAAHTLVQLRERGVDVRLSTTLESAQGRVTVLSDGSRFAARTLVWTAGVRPAPLLGATDLPLDAEGRVRCLPTLRVAGPDAGPLADAWAAGDCAAVPDPDADGASCPPNAQHAASQAELLADNLIASLASGPEGDYRPERPCASTSLGLRRGVAHTRRGSRTGRRAWLLHRARTLRRMPSPDRRVRILADWILAGLFTREVVSLGSLEHPRAEFEAAVDSSEA